MRGAIIAQTLLLFSGIFQPGFVARHAFLVQTRHIIKPPIFGDGPIKLGLHLVQ